MGSPARGQGSNCKLERAHVSNWALSSIEIRPNIQRILQMLINFHNGGLVTAPVAVVWSWREISIEIQCSTGECRKHTREDSHHVPILRPIVSLHYQLMRPCHQSQAVVVIKSLRDILPECVSSTPGGNAPAASVVGITPQQVAHRSLVGNLLDSIQRPDVVERVDGWTQTAVKAEDLVLDEGGKGEVVEEVGEVFPHVGVAIFAQALVVEAVHLRDLAGLVVSSKNRDPLGVPDLKADKQRHGLDGVVTPIDVVT